MKLCLSEYGLPIKNESKASGIAEEQPYKNLQTVGRTMPLQLPVIGDFLGGLNFCSGSLLPLMTKQMISTSFRRRQVPHGHKSAASVLHSQNETVARAAPRKGWTDLTAAKGWKYTWFQLFQSTFDLVHCFFVSLRH
jgi:hypothetical protein